MLRRIGGVGLAVSLLLGSLVGSGSKPAASATIPANGYRLLFSSNRGSTGYDLYSVSIDGSHLVHVTSLAGGERASNQSYSPGGGRIVFMRAGGNPDIYRVDADGTRLRRLTRAKLEDCCPVWSFDGKKIAFESKRTGIFEIFSMDRNGSNEVNLTTNSVYDGTPTWSPTGHIAFRSTISDSNDIFSMRRNGTHWKRLTFGRGVNRVPAWSPDGSKIAFVSNRTGSNQVYVMDADGSGTTQLTFTIRGSNLNPSWSPDGRWIAFYSNRSGNNEIYVMHADGSRVIRVTNNSASDILPSWCPRLTHRTGTC